jgi:rRNA-processing protein FCF1
MTGKSSASSSDDRRRGGRSGRRVVLLDTNALFLPIRTGFPLESEVARLIPGGRVLVAASGVRELDRLVERATPGASGARALAEKFVWTPADLEGDDGVMEVALRERATVVTADRALQERLRSSGLAVLIPRDRHRLELQPARRALVTATRRRRTPAPKPARQRAGRGNG